MQQLYLTYAEQRRLHGMDTYGAPSRFIKEIPGELIEEVRARVPVARPMVGDYRNASGRSAVGIGSSLRESRPGMGLGARVRHGKFGEGVILNLEGNGAHARVQVNFEQQGTKWLMLQYANLEPV
jgi:DNA helicase-2/ATP-dependent DNA helicase PcrA